jgi:hypothetical protein
MRAVAGYSGKRFIFEKCHELGVKVIVLDGPDSWAQIMEQVRRCWRWHAGALSSSREPVCVGQPRVAAAHAALTRRRPVPGVRPDAPQEGIIAKFVPIDFSDAEHAFSNCLKVRREGPLGHAGGRTGCMQAA